MGISHKSKIPKSDEISLWYDASNPKGTALYGINKGFERADLGGDIPSESDQTQIFDDHIAIRIDGSDAWSDYYKNAMCASYGLRDLSGNNYHCALIGSKHSSLGNRNRTSGAVFNESQFFGLEGKWYYEPYSDFDNLHNGDQDDPNGNANITTADSTWAEQSDYLGENPWPGAPTEAEKYKDIGSSASRNMWDRAHQNKLKFNEQAFRRSFEFDYNNEDFLSNSTFRNTRRPYTIWNWDIDNSGVAHRNTIDEFGLINGRPFKAIYAIIYNNTLRTTGPFIGRKAWRLVVNGKSVASADGYPGDLMLKPGDIVPTDDYGEFEIGPAITFTPDVNTVDDAGNTISNKMNEKVGATYHPVRPVASNTIFPQPKFTIDNFRRAVVPIIPVSDDFIVLRDQQLQYPRNTSINGVSSDSGGGDFDQSTRVAMDEFYIGSGHDLHECAIHPSNFIKDWYKEYEIFVYDQAGTLLGWYQTTNYNSYGTQRFTNAEVRQRRPGTFWVETIWQYSESNSQTYATHASANYVTSYAWTILRGTNEDGGNLFGNEDSLSDFDKNYHKGPFRDNRFTIVICPLTGNKTTTGSNAWDSDLKGLVHESHFPAVEYESHTRTPGFIETQTFKSQTHDRDDQFTYHSAWGAIDRGFSFNEQEFDTTSNFTVSLWIKGNNQVPYNKGHRQEFNSHTSDYLFDIGHFQIRLFQTNDSSYATYGLNGGERARIQVSVKEVQYNLGFTENSSSNRVAVSTETIPNLYNHNNMWHNITVTYDAVNNTCKIFFNGVEQAIDTSVSGNLIPGSFPVIGLNNSSTGFGRPQGYVGRRFNLRSATHDDDVQEVIECRWNHLESNSYLVGDTYEAGAHYRFSEVLAWKYTTLTPDEVMQLYSTTVPKYNPTEKPKVDLSHANDYVFHWKKKGYVPAHIDNALKGFTSSTSVSTVASALETAANPWQPINVVAVVDNSHVAEDLLINNTSGTPSQIAYYPNKAALSAENPRCWGDPKLDSRYGMDEATNTSPNTSPDRQCERHGITGIAAFANDKYLGTTYIFINRKDSPGAATPTLGPQTSDFGSGWDEILKNTGTNSLGSAGTHRGIESIYDIHGYTHDVSGYYTINGNPSSPENPYIVKTTEFSGTPGDNNVVNTNTSQGWSFSTNQGIPSTSYSYAQQLSPDRLSVDGGLWGWKQGEYLHGNMTPDSKQDGIWGIANWNGNDNASKAWWGPNKEFDIGVGGTDNVKFYVFNFEEWAEDMFGEGT